MAAWGLLALAAWGADAPAKLPLQYPLFVAFAPDGALWIGDKDAHAIFRVGADGKAEVAFQGDKKEYRTFAHHPRCLAFGADGTAFVADPATMDVLKIGADRKPAGLTGRTIKELHGQPGWRGELPQPEGVAVAADGTVYVADMLHMEIRKLAPGKTAATTVAKVNAVRTLLLEPGGTLLAITRGADALVRIDPKDGKATPVLRGTTPGKVDPFLLGLAAAPGGGWLLGDNYNKCVWRVTPDGKAAIHVADPRFKKVVGVAVNAAGNIAVADPASRTVWRVAPDKSVSPWVESSAPPAPAPPP